MMARLPVELLDIVAQYATMGTQANLSVVSRSIYLTSIRSLYESIPYMSTPRTTQCLRTLSTKPKVARLVRFFALRVSSPRVHQDLLTRALGNMADLSTLSLQLGVFARSSVLSQMTCRLTKFVCVVGSDEIYPISKFLSNQPAIEELYLICRPDELAGLCVDALPALRDLATPSRLLPKFPRSCLSQLSRLSVLGTIAEIDEFVELGAALELAKPPQSLELVMGVDITAFLMTTDVLAQGLTLLGLRAPFLRLLRLEIHRGHIRADALQNVFAFALPSFPNLRTLVVMSRPPAPNAYIREPPQLHQSREPPSPTAVLHTPTNGSSAVSSWYSSPQLPYDDAGNWPSLVPDALHDRSYHKEILSAWHHVHPELERVVFPVGAYTYLNKRQQKTV